MLSLCKFVHISELIGLFYMQVVLMSATLDAEKFINYFGGPKQCPSVKVPGRTFPVSAYYLVREMLLLGP